MPRPRGRGAQDPRSHPKQGRLSRGSSLRWLTLPARGDLLAGVAVALVLVPQSLAYAELAGMPVVNGLYTAAAATLAAGLAGSSPYLQTGPVALTSLLTFGALAPLAQAGSAEFIGYAAMLALVVGVVRVLLGALRWGVVAYLMSQPVVAAFTVAAALLILTSQIPALVDVEASSDNPFVAATQALASPQDWNALTILIGLGTIAVILVGRRLSPLFPGVLIAALIALGLNQSGVVDVTAVGSIPSGFPPLNLDLPWQGLGSVILPGIVIALVGFAEAASISRRYASEDRKQWDPNREFMGQGFANIGAGLFSGYPAGGSFSRSSLNRLSGARTRWSGVVTGVVILAFMPAAGTLSGLPTAALAGLVIAAVLPLIELRPFIESWRQSRPQFLVALPTFLATLAFAPRVERGVILGVLLSLAVHLWRELRLEVDTWITGDTLHVQPQGVLYFGSAPSLETQVMTLVADNPDIGHLVLHLQRLGRMDLTGALVLRAVLEDMERSGIEAAVDGVQPQAMRLVTAVLGELSVPTAQASQPSGNSTQVHPDPKSPDKCLYCPNGSS